jgi:hypothetical protein
MECEDDILWWLLVENALAVSSWKAHAKMATLNNDTLDNFDMMDISYTYTML